MSATGGWIPRWWRNIFTFKSNDISSDISTSHKVAALACDALDEDGPLKVLFKSNSLLRFVQQILNVPQLHRNIDPVGAVFVNIYKVDTITFTWGKIMFYPTISRMDIFTIGMHSAIEKCVSVCTSQQQACDWLVYTA